MEAFLRKQAEIEGSGAVGATATATVEQVADAAEKKGAGARAGPVGDEGAVLGADVVSDDVSEARSLELGGNEKGRERKKELREKARDQNASILSRKEKNGKKNSTPTFSSSSHFFSF